MWVGSTLVPLGVSAQKGDAALRRLAFDLLDQYDVQVVALRLIARSYNTVYAVRTRDGQRFALRVSPSQRLHRESTEAVEAGWVAALAAAGFPTPAVKMTNAGGVLSHASHANVESARTGVLFDWVAGRRLLDRPTLPRLRELGRLMAQLHISPTAQRGSAPDVAVADRVLYFDAPNVLATVPDANLFLDARQAAQSILDSLWRDTSRQAHLIHGDIHGANVMVNRNRLVVIDFQDLAWGLDIIDLSIMTAALRYFRRTETSLDPDAAVDALRLGYSEVRPWPDLSPYVWQALESARMLNVFNFTMWRDPQRPVEYFDRHLAIQRSFVTESRRRGVGG